MSEIVTMYAADFEHFRCKLVEMKGHKTAKQFIAKETERLPGFDEFWVNRWALDDKRLHPTLEAAFEHLGAKIDNKRKSLAEDIAVCETRRRWITDQQAAIAAAKGGSRE